jgi:PhoPQ-activated pathogenicity-related protein
MATLTTLFRFLCIQLICVAAARAQSYTWDDVTALDEYVQSDDGYFSFEYLAEYQYEGVDIYVVNMTSQKYQDESFVSKSVWWHIMGIAIPHDIRFSDAGFLFINGGSNRESTEVPPKDDIANVGIALLANDTGTCGAYINQVPNQPVVFTNDPSQSSRSEDSIIAWTWRTFLDATDKDPTVILRMPMTKAAKRGLDTVNLVAKEKAPETDIDRFVVAGASKRGWTTWSLACTDQRVVALIPMVFSMLNMDETIMNHYRNMDGAYSFAFKPYFNEGLTAEMYNPEISQVWDVEDMYRYRERLSGVPKILMVSSGDEFFLADDSQQWWNDMPEPKYMMMLPNAEHSMAPHYVKIYETAAAFWLSVLEEIELPKVSWTMQETSLGGLIVFNTVPHPRNITAWSAVTLANDTRRDYRLAAYDDNDEVSLHPVWWRQDVAVVDFGDGVSWGASVEQVSDEWVGFFVQGIWDGPDPKNFRLYLTSQVNVVPYTWPRDDCLTNEECYGYLV